MNKINRFSLVAFAAAIFTLPVFSQDENADDRDVEEIIVTGSKLAKTNFDSDVPIFTITGEEITNRMITTAGDAVAQLPNADLLTQSRVMHINPQAVLGKTLSPYLGWAHKEL